MRTFFKAMLVGSLVIVMVGISSQCFAQDPATKLGRGITNILTGWVELPKNIYETSVEENLFAGVTVGLAKGVGMTIVRTGAGVYELVTFPFPIPENYIPVLEPEFVFGG